MSRFARTTVVGKSLNINGVLGVKHTVKVQLKSKNLMNIYGYSASGINNIEYPRQLTNPYGTTISTTDISNSITVTQEILNTPSYVTDYKVGYFNIGVKNDFKTGDKVVLSFDLEIIDNPLNSPNMSVMPNGGSGKNFPINGNGRYSVPFTWAINTTYPERQTIEIRNAGCSCVFSNFQLELGEVATDYVPYEVDDFTGFEVKSIGKNLIPFPYKEISRTVNGITFTVNEDGSLHYEGTSTGAAQFHFTDYINQLLLTPGETYTVSVHADSNGTESTYTSLLNVNYKPVDKAPAAWSGSILDIAYIGKDGKPGSQTAVYPEDGTGGIQCYIHIPAGKTVNNTVRVMIEHGTKATEYELYKTSQVIASDSQGKVNGLKSYSPVMNLSSNSDDLIIECSYFPLSVRDINDSIKIQEMVDNTDLVVSTMNNHRNVVMGNPLRVNDVLDSEHVLQVQVMGKNLFNKLGYIGSTGLTSFYDAENDWITNIASSRREYVYVDITDLWHVLKATGKNVTFSFDIKTEIAGSVLFYTLGRYSIDIANNRFDATTDWQHKSFTVENTAFVYRENDTNGEKCSLSWYGVYDTGVKPYIRNLQIEVSDVETEYVPFCTDFTGKEVVVSGKNLLDLSSIIGTSITANGGMLICGEDGGITGSGTPTNSVAFYGISVDIPKGDLTFSASGTFTNLSAVIYLMDINNTRLDAIGVSVVKKVTFNLDSYPTFHHATLELKRDNNNVEMMGTMYIQLELGTEATEYEPYKEPVTATANIEGSVLGLRSMSPTMVITTDSGNLIKCGYFSESSEDVYAKYIDIKKAIRDAQSITAPEPMLTDIISGQNKTFV